MFTDVLSFTHWQAYTIYPGAQNKVSARAQESVKTNVQKNSFYHGVVTAMKPQHDLKAQPLMM